MSLYKWGGYYIMSKLNCNFAFSETLEGLYRRKFELKDLINNASTNRELEDKITRLESELARIEVKIDLENIRLYGSDSDTLIVKHNNI